VASGRLEPGEIVVEMEGGELQVRVGPDLELELRGPVVEVAEGKLTDGALGSLDG
jgi:diaminopimelate epimerase